ncbi:MAG: endonuclease/exonuclease/phosphatase family protein [Mucilaginibacter sp.]
MKAKKKLPFFDKIVLWINYAVGLALLISYLAPIADPRKYWVIAFFGLAYPLLLLANALLILYWAFRKNWYALLSAGCIVIGINVLNNNIAFNFGNSNTPKLTDTNAVRLMTYNVHNFKKYGASHDTSTRHDILALIKKQDPDIIGIQEYFTRKRGQYAMTDSMNKLLGYHNFYFVDVNQNEDEAIGIALFTKYKIINKGLLLLAEPGSENQCIYIDVKKANGIFRVYSVHLQSINFKKEDYKYLDTISSGKPDMISTRRLGGKLKRAFIKRAEQVFKIKAHAKQCPYPYIISGDFNDTPTSYVVNQMSKGLKNAFREKGFGLGRTYNGDFPNYQIDYVMATPAFDVKSYTIVEKKLSDHYPIITDLVLK